MKIQSKTHSGQISANITVNLFIDEDGMKYTVHDAECPQKNQELPLDIEVPKACRREIRRRMIPSIDGKTGVLPEYQELSWTTDKFIFDCWEEILLKEPWLENL